MSLQVASVFFVHGASPNVSPGHALAMCMACWSHLRPDSTSFGVQNLCASDAGDLGQYITLLTSPSPSFFLSLTSPLYLCMAGLPTYARTASVCPAVTAWKMCARCWQRERWEAVGNAQSKRRREAHSPQSCALTSGVGASYVNGASHSELPTPCRAFSGHRRGRCPRAASPSCAHEPDDARRFSVHF